jgi:hypothetical protein
LPARKHSAVFVILASLILGVQTQLRAASFMIPNDSNRALLRGCGVKSRSIMHGSPPRFSGVMSLIDCEDRPALVHPSHPSPQG